MLNIDSINNGFVLDHIQAGRAMAICHYLNLDELDCQVAIIKMPAVEKWAEKTLSRLKVH